MVVIETLEAATREEAILGFDAGEGFDTEMDISEITEEADPWVTSTPTPRPTIQHILGYDPAEAIQRLTGRMNCGLVVIVNRRTWQYCKLAVGHKEKCKP